jgi:hypothetical protein
MDQEIIEDINYAIEFRKKAYPVVSAKFFGKEWGGKANPSQWKEQTYAGIFYSLFREYDALIKAFKTDDHISIVALHSRNILELAVWADAIARDATLLRIYYEEGVRDMHDIAKSLRNWQARTHREDTNNDFFSGIQLSAQNLGVTDLNTPHTELSKIATGGQFEHHRTMLYKLLSKLMHATGLAIVMQINEVSSDLKAGLTLVAGNLFGSATVTLCNQTDLQLPNIDPEIVRK